MARRTFRYNDGKTDKFWSIELQGIWHTVRFGRAGTQGQKQSKQFASAAEAQKSHDRLVREKFAKGYVEETAGGAPPAPPAGAAAEPDGAAWREALLCFGVTPERAAAFAQAEHEDVVNNFTDAVLDTPFGVATDWKDEPTTALQYLSEGLEQLGVNVDVEDVDDQLQVFVRSGEGGELFVRRIADEDDEEPLHDVVFSFERVLPRTVELYSLVGCEESDTLGHAVLTAERWQRLRQLLGPAFDRLFRKHPPHGAGFRRSRKAPPSWQDYARRTVKDRKEWLADRENRKILEVSRQEVMDILERRKDSPLWKRHWTADRRFPQQREEFLASFGSPRRLEYITASLDTLALHNRMRGAVRVLEGDEGGWSLLRAGALYDYHHTRISLRHFGRIDDGQMTGGGMEGLDWALLLSQALGLGETAVAEWCGRAALRHPRAFDIGHPLLPLQPFLIRLYALWKQARLDDERFPQAKLGVYREVLDAWHDEGRLAAALVRACDYHARQARRDEVLSEFTHFPADLFPAEILAVYRVRRDLGLPTPEVQHPILATPLGRPPTSIPATPDDVLDRVMTAVEEELPD
jgi:predicted DNA-binding WGR domain protein